MDKGWEKVVEKLGESRENVEKGKWMCQNGEENHKKINSSSRRYADEEKAKCTDRKGVIIHDWGKAYYYYYYF